MANFEQLKGPMEVRAQLLKSCGLHVKDLIGSTAHITNAPLSLRHPDEEDLENLIGWNPAVKYAIKDLEDSGNKNRDGIYERLDRLKEMLWGLVEQMRAIQIAQENRNGKDKRKSDD